MPPEEQNHSTETNTTPPLAEPAVDAQSQPTPSYDFIQAQPDPTKKPNSKRRLAIIVGASLVLLLLTVAIIARQSTTSIQTADSNEVVDKAVNEYVSKMANGNYAEAFLQADTSSGVTEEYYKNTLGPLLASAYDMSSCTVVDTDTVETVYQTRVSCKASTEKGSYNTVIMVESTNKDNTVKIIKITEMGKVEG